MTDTVFETVDPAFAIRIRPALKLVEIDNFGFWSLEDFHRYEAALRKILPRLTTGGCAVTDQVTIIDMLGFEIQSQDVLAELARLGADRSIGSRRIALVLRSTLAKLQAKRAAPDFGMFTCRDEAMAWLMAEEPLVARAAA